MVKKANFERLKELEKRKHRVDMFFKNINAYPHIVLSKKQIRRKPFWEQEVDPTGKILTKNDSGFTSGTLEDLPDDLGLYEMVMYTIREERKKIEKEFEELLK